MRLILELAQVYVSLSTFLVYATILSMRPSSIADGSNVGIIACNLQKMDEWQAV